MKSTAEESLELAMDFLDQVPPPASETVGAAATPALHEQGPPEPQEPLDPLAPPTSESPTLAGLDESRRPKEKTACEECANSVWLVSPGEVKCYCRVMFLVTWTSKQPQQITACDGMWLGQEEG